jgi:hypothetical protein
MQKHVSPSPKPLQKPEVVNRFPTAGVQISPASLASIVERLKEADAPENENDALENEKTEKEIPPPPLLPKFTTQQDEKELIPQTTSVLLMPMMMNADDDESVGTWNTLKEEALIIRDYEEK